MFHRRLATFLPFVLVAALLPLSAFAEDKPGDKTMDDQYQAVASGRAKAEVAVRKTRSFFEENENRWRALSTGPEAAYRQIVDTITKSQQEEQRRTEELRNQAVIEELGQRRAGIDQDWQKYNAVERPTIENNYRQTQQQSAQVIQLYTALSNLETQWKDSKTDLVSLQAAYDAIAQRAEAIRAQGAKCVADLEKSKKNWESAAETGQRPGAPAKAG